MANQPGAPPPPPPGQPPPPPPGQPPGPPPPPPAPQQPSTLAWIGAGLLLATIATLAALTIADGDGARFAGALVGSLAISLAIAALIRWLVARTSPGRRVWAPSLLLIASGVAVLTLLGGLSNEADEREAIAECKREEDPGERFRSLPPEMTAEALDAATEGQLQEEFAKAAGSTGIKPEARRVIVDGQPVGVAIILPLGESDRAREEFKAGVTEGAGESGAAPPSDVQLGRAGEGFEVSFGPEGAAGRMVFGFAGCQAIGVASEDGRSAAEVVEELAVD